MVRVAIVAMVFVPRLADAHAVGISRGEYELRGKIVSASLVFARPEIANIVPSIDANHDGTISDVELQKAQRELEMAVVDRMHVRNETADCSGKLTATRLTEEDGLSIHAVFDCASAPSTAAITLGFLDSMSHGHRHLAARASSESHTVLYAGHDRIDVSASGGAGTSMAAEAWSLFRLGIIHILTGYDHLVFLFGLIVIGGRLRSTILALTAFTLAHSITLGLSALGIWSPGPSIVEPAIALSIAYVGIENWFVKSSDRRWLITFPFGLIHGFGFAGALREIALPAAQIPVALASFNVGVEAGQLLVLAAVLPVLVWLRRQLWFSHYGVRFASGLVAIAGGVWFIARIA
jgi:hydrogenase/urease accessory protein HupE